MFNIPKSNKQRISELEKEIKDLTLMTNRLDFQLRCPAKFNLGDKVFYRQSLSKEKPIYVVSKRLIEAPTSKYSDTFYNTYTVVNVDSGDYMTIYEDQIELYPKTSESQ